MSDPLPASPDQTAAPTATVPLPASHFQSMPGLSGLSPIHGLPPMTLARVTLPGASSTASTHGPPADPIPGWQITSAVVSMVDVVQLARHSVRSLVTSAQPPLAGTAGQCSLPLPLPLPLSSLPASTPPAGHTPLASLSRHTPAVQT